MTKNSSAQTMVLEDQKYLKDGCIYVCKSGWLGSRSEEKGKEGKRERRVIVEANR